MGLSDQPLDSILRPSCFPVLIIRGRRHHIEAAAVSSEIGSRTSMTKNRWLILAAITAVLAGGIIFFLARVLRDEPPPIPPVADLELTVEVQSDGNSEDLKTDLQNGLQGLLNTYYERAFLRPERWDPQPEVPPIEDEVFEAFSPSAKEQAMASINAFGLGELGPMFSFVDPVVQEARATAFRDADGSIPGIVVTTNFVATATISPDPPTFMDRLLDREPDVTFVDLAHKAELWLIPDGVAYRVIAFKVHLEADEQVTEAAFGEGSHHAAR